METFHVTFAYMVDDFTPHSLGKLIEWKRLRKFLACFSLLPPHSLGKLIEWKHRIVESSSETGTDSPLAGETN